MQNNVTTVTVNSSQTVTSARCALYQTEQTARRNVTIGCAAVDEYCLPDKLLCSVTNSCALPLGWCLPKDEYNAYMQYVEYVLKR